jgi:NNP family nitrate/nitrite transporter-like MFS transporter
MSRLIVDWDPENEVFWKERGKRIARKNLIWSIVAENIGFSVWLLWSVTAPRLNKVGFHYTTDELFSLVAIPGLVGAIMRLPYTFAVPKFGGRNWTVVSALLLVIPAISLAVLVQKPDTPYWVMAVAAASAGLGGGNFASSMANISFFYPDREKGFALGLNAAGGNIGVSTVQLVLPFLIGPGALAAALAGDHTETGIYLYRAGLFWLPFIAIAALGAFLFMNNLASARSNFQDQITVTANKHTWILSWLYIGCFGSFIGYSAAFPLLIKTQFPSVTADLAFLGPLIGSLARPVGGYLADKVSGAKVTFWNFVAMAGATVGVLYFVGAKSFGGFLAMFLVLFLTTGIGNGSTFRMIPTLFSRQHVVPGSSPEAQARAMVVARREGAAVIGLASAFGALGGFFIPRSFGASMKATNGPTTALVCFLLFYVTCIVLTFWHYRRRGLGDAVPAIEVAQPSAAAEAVPSGSG